MYMLAIPLLNLFLYQVYALTKERDALRRGAEKLTSANDLLKEKDDIITQVCGQPGRMSPCCVLYRFDLIKPFSEAFSNQSSTQQGSLPV